MVGSDQAIPTGEFAGWVDSVLERIVEESIQRCLASGPQFIGIPRVVLAQHCVQVVLIGRRVVHTRSSSLSLRAEACALSSAADAP